MIFNVRKPQKGDAKVKTRFAIIPTRIDINTVIWLEKYKARYQYGNFWSWLGVEENTWREINRWIEKDEVKE